jgi:hypothetical protein
LYIKLIGTGIQHTLLLVALMIGSGLGTCREHQ